MMEPTAGGPTVPFESSGMTRSRTNSEAVNPTVSTKYPAPRARAVGTAESGVGRGPDLARTDPARPARRFVDFRESQNLRFHNWLRPMPDLWL